MANFIKDHMSIIKYYGGKTAEGYMTKLRPIIQRAKQENGATTLYDLFGGGAHVALNMADEFDNIIYNEWSKCVYEFFKVVKDPKKANELVKTLQHIEPCDENFEIARTLMDNEYIDNGGKVDSERLERLGLTDVQMASITFIITMYSFHGNLVKFWDKGIDIEKVKKNIKDLQKSDIQQLMKNTELYNSDYWDIMKDHLDDKDAVFILDPPYMKETRGVGADNYSADSFNHSEFLDRCNQCKVPIIICGYKTELYDRELTQKGWKCISMGEFNVATVQTGGKKGKTTKKEEFIWTNNFDVPDRIW